MREEVVKEKRMPRKTRGGICVAVETAHLAPLGLSIPRPKKGKWRCAVNLIWSYLMSSMCFLALNQRLS